MTQFLPQHIQYGVASTVRITIPERPSATYTVSCYGGSGQAIFEAATATLDSVATTLSAAAAAGAATISATSATGIAKNDTLWLTGEEEVVVKSVSGTTVTLRRPLMDSHASGAAVESHDLSYSVSAALAGTRFWDGRLEWTVDSGAPYVQPCICTSYRWYRSASAADWYDEEPKLYDVLDSEYDVERHLDLALADVIKRIGTRERGRVWNYIGPDSFRDATILAAQRRLYRRTSGEESRELYERYTSELSDELERVMSSVAWRDANQDGAVDEAEQPTYRSIRMLRG